MSWQQVRALHAAGMEIGSHGVHHRMLAKLDADGIEHELAVSRDRIAQETGQAPISLAYPVGGVDAYDERVIGIARRLGYRVACSYQPGVNRLVSADWHALRRIAVERDTSAAMFAARLAVPELFGNRPRSARS
jgi:peptidoglycan/xylan/chitin deacetylase (PgdA/CDA1 family)